MQTVNDPIDPVKKLDAALITPTALKPSEGQKPVAIDQESQLVMDDHLIDQMTSLHRRLNPPRKQAEPVLMPRHPWEGSGIMYGQVIPHENQYRLYYRCCHHTKLRNVDFQEKHGYTKTPIAMAMSGDAVHFTQDPIEGAAVPNTNIVVNDLIDCFSIVKDEAASNPEQRFKAVCSRREWFKGLTLASSPDGIRWSIGQEHAVINFGDRNSFWFDSIQKVFVAWSRCYNLCPIRAIVHMETADFNNWSDPRLSQPRLVMAPDRDDHPMTQFYGGYAFWYRSLYIAYLEVYYLHHQRIDTQLVCSRDGRTWTRLCHRAPFLANGAHEEMDSYWITPTFNPPIRQGEKLLIHYHAYSNPHIQPGFGDLPTQPTSVFGVATLRDDGFVSLDATAKEGLLLTKPLAPPPGCRFLEINAAPFSSRTQVPMRIQVDVLSENMEPVESHLLQAPPDCTQVWRRIGLGAALPAGFRLQFRLTNARLYSFRVKED